MAGICHGRYDTSTGQDQGAPSHQPIWKTKLHKHLLLGVGFSCIILCFILAAMGYMKRMKTCPTKCEEKPYMFSEAQKLRLIAALLFIVGISLIIVFVWTIKRENTRNIIVQDILVSNVTAEGLLKSPAPELPHPYSQPTQLVYEPSANGSVMDSSNSLPNYESAVDLVVKHEGSSSVTRSGEIININGVEMKSVSIQVDEDDINPPPSYLQALEMQNETQQELVLEQRDNG